LNASAAEKLFQKLNASFASARSIHLPQSVMENEVQESKKLLLLLIVCVLLMTTSIGLQMFIIFRKPNKQPEKPQKDSNINMLSVFGQNSMGDDDNDDRF
jgi:hypothetical protein